jgi:hypothetical protein
METLVNIGNSLTLKAQLSDGEESLPLSVNAIIRGPDGISLEEVLLAHVGGGLFINVSLTMPELDFITVQYVVLSEDQLTVDDSYSVGLDVFRSAEMVGVGSGSQSTPILIENEYIVEVADVSY